jgi:hypothetical protein
MLIFKDRSTLAFSSLGGNDQIYHLFAFLSMTKYGNLAKNHVDNFHFAESPLNLIADC